MDARNLAPWSLNSSSRAQLLAALAALGTVDWQLRNLDHDLCTNSLMQTDGIELDDNWMEEAINLVSKLYTHFCKPLGLEPFEPSWTVYDVLPVTAVLHRQTPEQYMLENYQHRMNAK